MLDAGLTESARLAALTVSVAYVAMAGYWAFLASALSGEAAPAWFAKILLTGVGGLNELKGIAATRPAD